MEKEVLVGTLVPRHAASPPATDTPMREGGTRRIDTNRCMQPDPATDTPMREGGTLRIDTNRCMQPAPRLQTPPCEKEVLVGTLVPRHATVLVSTRGVLHGNAAWDVLQTVCVRFQLSL